MVAQLRYTIFLLMAVPLFSQAQQRDSVSVTGSQDDSRNVMFDASASAKPRDIPIGLPGETGGTMIFLWLRRGVPSTPTSTGQAAAATLTWD